MVYAYTQDVPIDADLYAPHHRCARGRADGRAADAPLRPNADGGLRYIDVWETEEQCDRAFEERVHPAVDAAFGGAPPAGRAHRHPLDVVDVRGPAVGVRA